MADQKIATVEQVINLKEAKDFLKLFIEEEGSERKDLRWEAIKVTITTPPYADRATSIQRLVIRRKGGGVYCPTCGVLVQDPLSCPTCTEA
jgi:rubrerythrin